VKFESLMKVGVAAGILGWIVSAALSLAVTGAAIYVIVHFVLKFW